MGTTEITKLDRILAAVCERCLICRQARRSQRGIAFSIVKSVETALCPFCRAYERVNGVKAHEKREKPQLG